MIDTEVAKRWLPVVFGLALMMLVTTVAAARASPSPAMPDDPDSDAVSTSMWRPVLRAGRGPGAVWVQRGLEGPVAVFQPVDGPAAAWRSADGLDWERLELPPSIGAVSDVQPWLGGLALIANELRSNEAWSFDVWTSDDGDDWQLASAADLGRHPDLATQPRTILGFRPVEGGFVAFESYSSAEPDPSASGASSSMTPVPSRVFVWHAPLDGTSWERHEVEGPGRDVIGSGVRLFEGDRQKLHLVQPGSPPRLLESMSGIRWKDVGALGHGLNDPEGALALATLRDGFLVAGREDGLMTVSRGAPDGHWVHVLTRPGVADIELHVDRNVAILAGTTVSPETDVASPRHSFVATSTDRGRTWREQPDMAALDLCLGPLTSIGEVALLGSGCSPTGGMAILAAELDSFDVSSEPPMASTVPSAPHALECDFRGSRTDSGRGHWEGEPGYDSPREAMDSAIGEGWVIPQYGYRELARDDTAVLYGYKHRGEVKVAVRVVAVRGAQDDWLPDRLAACRLSEFGLEADMGPGVWLWANRWARTVQERRGPAHCGWQSARFLYWARPDAPQTVRATALYLRDPRGLFRDQWEVPFLRSTTLPPDARKTGYRRDGAVLWLAVDERSMYVKDGVKVERWPRVHSGIGCA